jgi:hypothetical protein
MSLCLTKYRAMKTYGGVEVWLRVFLASALDGGGWSSSRPGRFAPGRGVLVTHLTGDWVGSRAGLDEVAKKKSPPLLRTPVVQPVAQSLYWLSYPGSYFQKELISLWI